MSSPSPKILDVTVRDGGYLINHQFSSEKIKEITQGFKNAGIQYAEISHGCGIGAIAMGYPGLIDDDELMVAAKDVYPELKISAFISPHDYSLPVIPGLAPYMEIGRVGVNVDEITCGKRVIEKLKKYEKIVSVQLVRTHGRPPETAAEAARQAKEMGADIVYLVDTFGSMRPTDVEIYMKAIQAEVDLEIGFHGHNNLDMAIPNTLKAWELGAEWLDASLMGVGRGAGNAVLETLVHHLQIKGLRKDLKISELGSTTDQVILPLFRNPPFSSLTDILMAHERIDFTPHEIFELLSGLLHVPLEEILSSMHAKMGNSLTLAEEHIRSLVNDHGADFDSFWEMMKKK